MKNHLLSFLVLSLFGLSSNAQESCGTMQSLERMMKEDPSIKAKMDEMEKQTQDWIKNNNPSRDMYAEPQPEPSNSKYGGNPSIMSLCGNDNTLLTTLSAPTAVAQIVSPSPNCVNGGKFVTVTGLVAGNIYRISTCGTNVFNTQLTIYKSGVAVAHNDDYCGTQSSIYFNPITSGNYDILVDAYNCTSNSLCASLEIELYRTPRPVITIPVVFHIFHNGEAIGTGRNLSQARIDSQMVMLNRDFRRLNGDVNSTPAALRGVSDDPLIEFCLADRDPSGSPTTGVVRILGAYNYTEPAFNAAKPTSYWDRDKYLNIWTADLLNMSGYAQFPGTGPANTDGIAIDYSCISPVPGSVPDRTPYGRATIHEVGHWLNLRHVWADENGCGADDFVDDTPRQAIKTPDGTAPTFPVTDACSPSYPGVMFNNYMDYSSALVTCMFTRGQSERMDACLSTSRVSLKTSNGCSSNATTGVNTSGFSNSISVYPNPGNGIFNVAVAGSSQHNLELYNVIGKKVFEITTSEKVTTIDLSGQSSGVYFLQVNSGNTSAVTKLIINK